MLTEEQHFPPESAEAVARYTVHHESQAHPNNLVDSWWMHESLARGYAEILYKEWPLDLEDVGPSSVGDQLPEGVALVRRGTLLTSRRVECVLQGAEALAAVDIARRRCWVAVAGRDLKSAQHLLQAVEEAFPQPNPVVDEDAPRIGLNILTHGEHTRAYRELDVAAWSDIQQNYAFGTRDELAALMDPTYQPQGGRLHVWYGSPGTGKTFALQALAHAWRDWAAFAYVADPDAFLGDSGYLLEWMTLRHPENRWIVAILEDTGELFGVNAGASAGQGLSRLLNASDGMLGRGCKTLFIITTNEPISRFHEAVIRPGRCGSCISFEPLPVEQAKTWLLGRGAAEAAKRLRIPATVAELFAMAEGNFEQLGEPPMGMYL